MPLGKSPIPIFCDDAEKRFFTLLRYEDFVKREPNGERLVAALLREMALNLSNYDFDLAAYIRQSGYSADHFRRCFKRETGTTPAAYLIALRIERARRMLDLPDHGGYTIKQIAQLSGFADPYYFSTMFKRTLGCSPTAYLEKQVGLRRKKARGKHPHLPKTFRRFRRFFPAAPARCFIRDKKEPAAV